MLRHQHWQVEKYILWSRWTGTPELDTWLLVGVYNHRPTTSSRALKVTPVVPLPFLCSQSWHPVGLSLYPPPPPPRWALFTLDARPPLLPWKRSLKELTGQFGFLLRDSPMLMRHISHPGRENLCFSTPDSTHVIFPECISYHSVFTLRPLTSRVPVG